MSGFYNAAKNLCDELYYRGYSPYIESTPNRKVISEEEYEQLMEQKRKERKVDRSLWYLLDK